MHIFEQETLLVTAEPFEMHDMPIEIFVGAWVEVIGTEVVVAEGGAEVGQR